jgi:ABC-type nickel/cobalt efflux system permease component RcnA
MLALIAALVALPLAGGAQKAAAHPLGNFTINHYSRIELSSDGVRVRFVLDMAEIPAFQERREIDTDGDGAIAQAESDAYLSKQVARLRDRLSFEINGASIALQPISSSLSFPPGQGGLDTLRIEADFVSPLPDGWERTLQEAEFHDANYAERIGWREIIVRSQNGVRIVDSTAPAQDVSNELSAYPESQINNPLNVDDVSFSFQSGATVPTAETGATQPVSDQTLATRNNPDASLARYAGLIAKDRLTIGVALIALLAAIGFGALHALSPGHGKTIVAAYLVGSRGTWRHALLLSLTVTATHTSSVYALGFVTLYLSQYILPEDLYPWLSVASGALILAMGLSLFVGRLRSSGLVSETRRWLTGRFTIGARPRLAFAGVGVSTTPEARAMHSHAATLLTQEATTHRHGFGPAHSHSMPGEDGQPVTAWRLVGLGIFGGLLPCPSAIVVMLSAIALHRVAFGLLLIVAFSLGLAAVLTAIGFALVYAGPLSKRLPFVRTAGERFAGAPALVSFAVRAFPVASAAAVLSAGLVVLLRGLSQQGFL